MKKGGKDSTHREKEGVRAPGVPQAPRVKKATTTADAVTHKSSNPTVQAALTLKDYNKPLGEMSLRILVDSLAEQCDLANKGDLKRAETMLMAQAHTLDAIFHTLARRAHSVDYLNQFDVYLRLSLKAQSQCRATLEALAAIKYPQSVAFVRQANIAHGPQQVNNGTTQTDAAPRAREIENQPNKLLESRNDEQLDPRAPRAASKADSSLETVATIHRAKDT